MKKSDYIKFLRNLVYLKYCSKMTITFKDLDEDNFGSYIIRKEIEYPNAAWENPTEWTLLAFLHEIGHVMTNTPNMKRYYQEYLATQWALDEAKEIGFDVPRSYIGVYQRYIYKWLTTSIKHKAKKVHGEEELALQY